MDYERIEKPQVLINSSSFSFFLSPLLSLHPMYFISFLHFPFQKNNDLSFLSAFDLSYTLTPNPTVVFFFFLRKKGKIRITDLVVIWGGN
jgi:hypothetical protein